MFEVTVTFVALAHGIAGNTFPAATAQGTVKFPTQEACKAAGEIIYGSLSARVDAVLRASGVGVLQGAKIDCKPDREQI